VPYRFVVLALILGVQTATNVGVLGLPSLAPLIRADLGLTRQEAGSFISAFYVGGILTSLPAGWPTDWGCAGRCWAVRRWSPAASWR
jgi:predicted MFS family arabinose efflux permease